MRLSLILLFLLIWGNVDVSLSQSACSGVPSVLHADVSEESKKSEYAHGDVIYFTCEVGYISGPTIKYACTNEGWQVVRPGTCYLRPCGLPDNTPNGYYQLIHGEDFVFGASVQYFCNEGYYMVSKQDTRTCLLDNWSNHVPVCEPSSCDLPPADLGVTVKGVPENDNLILPDRFLTFSCDEPGKSLNGSAQLICGKDGQWSSPFPSCEDITCKAEVADPHLNINGLPSANEPMKIGHKLQFSCDQEYTLDGSEEVECLQSGQWNKPFPTCSEGCHVPGVAGVQLQRKLRKGQKLTFRCREGQYIRGKAEIECLANGQLSAAIPTCEAPLSCGKPPSLQDGDTLLAVRFDYDHGSKVEYTCQRYYVLDGATHKTCINGEWIGEMRCLKPCAVSAELMRQRHIEFKVRYVVIEYVTHNDAVEYKCNSGRHARTGNMRQRCVDGEMDMPSCQ